GRGLKEAARIAEIDHTSLSRIESGERPTALQNLPGLEKAYDVPLEALQVARSGQIPSVLIRYLFEPIRCDERKTENFPVRITPAEKRELTLFLGYLRFGKR
ncbi:helix-turn-helix domain-containing protein, partial [Chloroflexota bacterium]